MSLWSGPPFERGVAPSPKASGYGGARGGISRAALKIPLGPPSQRGKDSELRLDKL